MRNIGNAFVRLGQFQDAFASFEQIMDGSADLQTGFNLVLCYYASGEKERMKKAFSRLLSVRELGMEDEDALAADAILIFNERNIDDLIVVNAKREPIGLVDSHDLPKLKAV